MSETTIESLGLEITSNFESAGNGLEALSSTLSKLKSVTKGGLGLTAVIRQIRSTDDAAKGIDAASVNNLNGLANAIEKLTSFKELKISASIPKQIISIGESVKGLNGVDFSPLTELKVSLNELGSIEKINLGSALNQLGRVPEIANAVNSADMATFSKQTALLASAFAPLSGMPKNNLSSYLTQLQKIPDILKNLDDDTVAELTKQIRELAAAFEPLGTQMQRISNGFSAFPTRIQRLIQTTNNLSSANVRASRSYINLYARLRMAVTGVRQTSLLIASFINKENEYIENINLFTASMGKYADAAQEYAEKVGELVGIDPGEWMRNQGVFMTLATGFGVAGDRAYTMSQQLTQLGYDLSSFFNISFKDAMQKLQSGISGELEPLRRLGYDLSQAKLQAIALSIGIDKTFSSMTQAEKAHLRYYAIMTQVTTAHGDMARTLNAPANQLRILNSQLTQASRAIGSIFIPALNSILPYAIAVAKVVRDVASAIASLFGFEMPEVDYSGIESVTGGMSDDLDNAVASARELKKTLLGIDEINRMNGNDGSSGVDNSLGDGFDFKLPTYDFLEGAVESRVAQIVEEMKEWLGITGEIDSWADLFDTRLGQILASAVAIGGVFLAWKLTDTLFAGIETVQRALSSIKEMSRLDAISLGLKFTIAGMVGSAISGYDMGRNGASVENILGNLISGALTVAGITLLTGSLAAGFVIGIPLWLTITGFTIMKGEKAALKEKYKQSDVAKELAEIRENIAGKWEIVKEVRVKLKTMREDYDNISAEFDGYRELIKKAFDLSDIKDKTAEDVELLKSYVTAINELNLDGLRLEYDESTQTIKQTREEIENVIKSLEKQAKTEALYDMLVEAYQQQFIAEKAFNELVAEKDKAFGVYNKQQRKLDELKSEYENVTRSLREKTAEFAASGTRNIVGEMPEEIQNLQNRAKELADEIKLTESAVDDAKEAVGDSIGPLIDAQKAVDEATSSVQFIEQELGNFGLSAKENVSIVSEELGKLPSAAKDAAEGMKAAFRNLPSFLDDILQKISKIPKQLSDLDILERYPQMFSGMVAGSTSRSHSIGGVNIPQFADGGIPTAGQLFIAREAGAELVGNVGGRTAVMNNDQIVESVSQGVADANAEQNVLLREQNALLRQILAKDSSSGSGYPSASDIVNGISRKNRRAGKTVVPVGV